MSDLVRQFAVEALFRFFLLLYPFLWSAAWVAALPYYLLEPGLRTSDHLSEFAETNSAESLRDFVRMLFSPRMEHLLP